MTTSTTATSISTRSATRLLLAAGVIAGPMFVVTAGVQALTRDGFDLSHQPLSLLSLGDLGWIQITNFVLAGLLSLAFAVGVGRATDQRARPAAGRPRLLAVFGIGLIIGGVFVPDAALGYPVGTPDGYRAPSACTACCMRWRRRWRSSPWSRPAWWWPAGSRRKAWPGAAVVTRVVAVGCLFWRCRSGRGSAGGCSPPSRWGSPGSPRSPCRLIHEATDTQVLAKS